jgi:hypothetical protein
MQSKIAAGLPEESVAPSADFQIVIPYRSPQGTRAALKYALRFAAGLDVRFRLVDVHVVPYGLPLDHPSVNPGYLERRLKNLAQESDVPVFAHIVYARDWEQGFRRMLGPRSVVLLAMKRSWWRTSEKRLAARLRKLGHQVIWVEYE